MRQGLRRGGARLLVVALAVDDHGVAVAGAAVHHLPDVQHAAAGRVDEHAALLAEVLHVGRGHAERRQDHHVAALDHRVAGCRVLAVRQDDDPHLLEPGVDVGIVDDLAEQKGAAIGKAPARFVGVLDRSIDAVAEPELARELQANVTDRRFVAERLQLGDHGAVVTLLEREAHLPFEAEALLKVGL